MTNECHCSWTLICLWTMFVHFFIESMLRKWALVDPNDRSLNILKICSFIKNVIFIRSFVHVWISVNDRTNVHKVSVNSQLCILHFWRVRNCLNGGLLDKLNDLSASAVLLDIVCILLLFNFINSSYWWISFFWYMLMSICHNKSLPISSGTIASSSGKIIKSCLDNLFLNSESIQFSYSYSIWNFPIR